MVLKGGDMRADRQASIRKGYRDLWKIISLCNLRMEALDIDLEPLVKVSGPPSADPLDSCARF